MDTPTFTISERWRLVALCLLLWTAGCDGEDDPAPCATGTVVALPAESCLVFEGEAQLGADRQQAEQVLRQAFADVRAVMPVDGVEIRVVVDPSRTIPELGIGGFNPDERTVMLFLDPGFPELAASLAEALAPMLAHELHHARRRRSVGYGATLFEAMISEGLADHFSIEVTGIEPPLWSRALTGETLATWEQRARQTWSTRPYDHAAWFFGTDPAIPRWTGYAVGFDMVGRYLSAVPGRRASAHVDTPAEAFLPGAASR